MGRVADLLGQYYGEARLNGQENVTHTWSTGASLSSHSLSLTMSFLGWDVGFRFSGSSVRSDLPTSRHFSCIYIEE